MVSIVIPCYNCAKFISRAVNSVLNQTLTDWELILVNNCSTDGTAEVLADIAKSGGNKIKVLFEEKHGAPAARNRGLRAAKGDWIQFLDADDELLPEKIEGQYEIARKKDPVVIVSPCTIREKRQEKSTDQVRTVFQRDLWIALLTSKLGITSANLWKREDLVVVGGWDERLPASQEYDLLFRLLKEREHVEFDLRNSTIVHLVSGESVSRSSDPDKTLRILESRLALRQRIKEYLASKNCLNAERQRTADVFIFQHLYERYRYQPDYVTERLRTAELLVPLSERLKGRWFMFKMDLKRILGLK